MMNESGVGRGGNAAADGERTGAKVGVDKGANRARRHAWSARVRKDSRGHRLWQRRQKCSPTLPKVDVSSGALLAFSEHVEEVSRHLKRCCLTGESRYASSENVRHLLCTALETSDSQLRLAYLGQVTRSGLLPRLCLNNDSKETTTDASSICRTLLTATTSGFAAELLSRAPAKWLVEVLCSEQQKTEVRVCACLALAELTDAAAEDGLESLFHSNDAASTLQDACQTLVMLVAARELVSPQFLQPALHILGNVAAGSEGSTAAVLSGGVLIPELAGLLTHPDTTVRKEVAWLASNVAAGTQGQIEIILASPGFCTALCHALEQAEWATRAESAWALSNICVCGTRSQLGSLVQRLGCERLLTAFCDLLDCKDIQVLRMALGTVQTLLPVLRDTSAEPCSQKLEECNGLEKIVLLQQHRNDAIAALAIDIEDDLFYGGDSTDVEEFVSDDEL